MNETVLTNAKLVLLDEVIEGTLVIRDGRIATVAYGKSTVGEDVDGDFLVPGLVELHTDHLESHYHPRPGVEWPPHSAVMSHDAQIAAAGITTVFDALRAGTFGLDDVTVKNAARLTRAIKDTQTAGYLRAQHFIHLRCEIPCPDTVESAEHTAETGDLHLISIMDHTPGARQFISIDKFKEYYLGRKLISPEKIEAYIEERRAYQTKYAETNKRGILGLARRLGVPMASHDDATSAHVDEAIAQGVTIAEFPTTKEAAEAAHKARLAVLMGAPNVVRGGSHSGNISAIEIAAGGHLDILSSDYVPASLLASAFALPKCTDAVSLPETIAMVTRNPARAAGLNDRGALEPGLRADLVQLRLTENNLPVVRRVWSGGKRVI